MLLLPTKAWFQVCLLWGIKQALLTHSVPQGSPHGWLPMARVGGRGSKDGGADTGGQSSEAGGLALLAGPHPGSGMGWKARNYSGETCFLDLLHKGDTEAGAALVLCFSPSAPGTLWGTWLLPTPGPGHSDMPSPGPTAWLVLVQFPGVWVWTRWLAGTHHPVDIRVGS